MLTKTKLALAAALVLGAASAVQANDNDRNGGGYRVGPLRQSFQGANPAYHPSMRHHPSMREGAGAYAFAPAYGVPARPYRSRGETRFERDWFGYQDCPGTEGDC